MHGLQHTHATLVLEDGTHPKCVQDRQPTSTVVARSRTGEPLRD
jgi:hypothetical protein